MTVPRILVAAVALATVPASVAAAPLAREAQSSAVGRVADADGAMPPEISLDVMTFNIRTSTGRDGDDAWPYRKELVAETIALSRPDVFGLQEALTDQIEYLAAALPGYRWLGVDRGLNGGTGLSEAVPIFYRHAALVPIESGTFWLGDAPTEPYAGRSGGRGGSRIVTWARFHHLETGRQLWVFNTHFTLREGPRQLDGITRINERVAALPTGSAVVVMGDFNSVAGSSETWDVATSGGLRDAWRIAEARQGPAVTSNGFGPPPDDWEGRIDWILVGGPVEVADVATVVHSRDGRYPSDHYPVRATLRIGPG